MFATTRHPQPGPAPRSLAGVQALVCAGLALVIVGLLVWPEPTLAVFWHALVPLLPLSFLVNTALWRAVCPLATVSAGGRVTSRGRVPEPAALRRLNVLGMALLLAALVARRVSLDTDGTVLALLLVGLVAVAGLTGRRVRAKGGFCNAFCPVLPVERLYGQAPLLPMRNARCAPCVGCAVRDCVDIDPAVTVRNAADTGAWLRSPGGVFATAFPGVILGHGLASGSGVSALPEVLLMIIGGGLVSLVVTRTLIRASGMALRFAAPSLAATCVGLYYWFAAPAAVAAFGGGAGLGLSLRAACLASTLIWLIKALQSARAVVGAVRAGGRPESVHTPGISSGLR